MKTAQDLMTSPDECLAPDETIVTAARMLSKYDVGSMPILDGDTLVGVVTDRDIVVNAVAKGVDGGKVVGMVAQADVARDLDEGTTGEVVEEISQA